MRGFFWYLMPFFVLISGNFSPYRIGPVSPIYILIALYVLVNIKVLINILYNNGRLTLFYFIFIFYTIFFSMMSINVFNIQGNEFNGAISPSLYTFLGVFRYTLILFFVLIVSRVEYLPHKNIYRSILSLYLLLLSILVLQVFAFNIFNIELGYIYHYGDAVRYGGLTGEPQTLSAWIFTSFLFLYTYKNDQTHNLRYKFFLLLSMAITLIFTESTVWILAFLSFIVIYFKYTFYTKFLILGLLMYLVFGGLGQELENKIYGDLLLISERSITIVAGFEVFSNNFYTYIFGYGASLSPYLIINTEIMETYPWFNLSNIGRQNVMNTYLEILFEFGIFGVIIFLYLFFKNSNIVNIRTFVALIPIFIGIFSIGGGFVASYSAIFIPLIVNNITLLEDKKKNIYDC